MIVRYIKAFLFLTAAMLAGVSLGLLVPPAVHQNSSRTAKMRHAIDPAIIEQARHLLDSDTVENPGQIRVEELQRQIQSNSMSNQGRIEHCRLAANAQNLRAISARTGLSTDEPVLFAPEDLRRLNDYISGIVERNK